MIAIAVVGQPSCIRHKERFDRLLCGELKGTVEWLLIAGCGVKCCPLPAARPVTYKGRAIEHRSALIPHFAPYPGVVTSRTPEGKVPFAPCPKQAGQQDSTYKGRR
jgi:hypothetical protein